jgi:hypothetical protein
LNAFRLLAGRLFCAALLLFLLADACLGLFASLLFGQSTRVFLCLLASLLFFNAATTLRLDALAFATLRLDAVILALYGFFSLTALRVDLVLMLASSLFQYIALDVGGLTPHLNVDGTGTTLRAGELQLALRFSPERDLARRRITAVVTAPVSPPKVREQLELRIIADAIVWAGDLDACLIQLHEQPIDGHLQDLGELCNCNFCHEFASPPPQWPASNQ